MTELSPTASRASELIPRRPVAVRRAHPAAGPRDQHHPEIQPLVYNGRPVHQRVCVECPVQPGARTLDAALDVRVVDDCAVRPGRRCPPAARRRAAAASPVQLGGPRHGEPRHARRRHNRRLGGGGGGARGGGGTCQRPAATRGVVHGQAGGAKADRQPQHRVQLAGVHLRREGHPPLNFRLWTTDRRRANQPGPSDELLRIPRE